MPITSHATGIPLYYVDPVNFQVSLEVMHYQDHKRGNKISTRIPLGKQAVWKSDGSTKKETWKETFHREAMQEIAKDPKDFGVEPLTDDLFPITADFESDDNHPWGIHLRGFVPARILFGEPRDYPKEDKEEDGNETLGQIVSVEIRNLFFHGLDGIPVWESHIPPGLRILKRIADGMPQVMEVYEPFLNSTKVRAWTPQPFNRVKHLKILEYIKRR